MRKMGSTDAINPETGMEISGRFGTYKLIEKIGGGGNGTVYSVEVINDGKQLPEGECFVIKILNVSSCGDKEREKRFEKEIKYVYQIQSEIEGVIPIYDSSYFLDILNLHNRGLCTGISSIKICWCIKIGYV